MGNRLTAETSPYLRQHADNPVDWFPWGEEAFAEARERDVPILLSVGYSACHWCHVMAHESFEDEQVAQAVNTGYVAVKVDREERPDVDAVYMAATTALTGHGGWPMTCLLTPTGEPFWAGTYLPREAFAEGALVACEGSSWCEWKGAAAYFDVRGGARTAPRAAWTYPSPAPGFESLRGHVALMPGMMDRCLVAGEQVLPQEGGFYGGWIT